MGNKELAKRLVESLTWVRNYMLTDARPYVNAMTSLLADGRISADEHETLCELMSLHPAPTDTLLEQELEGFIV